MYEYIGVHAKYHVFLYDYNYVNFLDSFSIDIKISNIMKILTVVTELFHVDGRTDMKLMIAFAVL